MIKITNEIELYKLINIISYYSYLQVFNDFHIYIYILRNNCFFFFSHQQNFGAFTKMFLNIIIIIIVRA